MKIKSPFFLFEESEHFFVFDGGDANLLEIPELYFDCLKYLKLYDLYDDTDRDEVISLLNKKYRKDKIISALDDLKKSHEKGFLTKCGSIYQIYDAKTSENKHHNGLWLNISHDCNLRCEYCFGNGGDYGKKRMLMDTLTAKKCIDKWYEQVDLESPLIEVNFFGGEPLMNPDVMIYCVNYINKLFENNPRQIRYNVTTNGTIVNEPILKLLKENNFKISSSIDGIEKIHNLKRKYASGKGSYSDIKENIKEYKKCCPKLAAQITLVKEGIPYLSDAVQNLWEMGINMVYSNLVFSEDEEYTYEHYRIYHNEIRKLSTMTYQNLVDNKPYTYQNLVNDMFAIKTKRFSTNCFFWGGGAMIFSPEGERYRCSRFMENEEYKLQDEIGPLSEKKPRVEKCSNCWAQLLCADGCVYENSVYSDNITNPAEEWCVKIKISLEEALKLYARLFINRPDILNKMGGK